MSDQEARELYYNDSFHRLLFTSNDSDSSSIAPFHHPSQYMNFSDNYLHGSADYISPYLSSTYTKDDPRDNSPVMISSSMEGGNEEEANNINKKYKQSELDGEDNTGGESSKKINKPTKVVVKKEKAPRFAFVTRSETDHLEDGYRWRKYGQKALKNSPYPRGYYRCTTQNCRVKKRVERSFQDPSTVITTYEGSHNHHLPPTLRANQLAIGTPSFHDPLNYRPIHNCEDTTGGATRSSNDMYYHDDQHQYILTPLQHLQFYG